MRSFTSSALEKRVAAVMWAQEKLTPRSPVTVQVPAHGADSTARGWGALRPPWVPAPSVDAQSVGQPRRRATVVSHGGEPQRSLTAPSPRASLCTPTPPLQHEYAALNTRWIVVRLPRPAQSHSDTTVGAGAGLPHRGH